MKRRSAKTAALYREWTPIRLDFLAEFNHQCCNCGGYGASVHEILNGPYRMRAFVVRATWLPLCGVCNCDIFTDKKQWPLEKQLALKSLVDPQSHDLAAVQTILLPRRFAAADVAKYVRQLKRLGFESKTT
jgi:hypothetical protein